MAKRIRVSSDNGTTWNTLPGNTGELSLQADSMDDTVFGQSYASSQTGVIQWTTSANAYFKGFAGYVAKILKQGTSTVMTDEACTLVSGKTYRITNAAKRIINRNVTVTVKVAGSAVSVANIESLDYLFGQVTFASTYTVGGAVTITAEYYPTTAIGCANEFTLTQTAEAVDTTCLDVAQTNSGHRTFDYGLKTVSLELKGIYKTTNAYQAALIARSTVIIEINLEGSTLTYARGYFKPMEAGQSGDVGAQEEESVTYELSVPDDALLYRPFGWYVDPTSTLNAGVKICLDAWQNATAVDVAYVPDGVTGQKGDAIVTDVSLSGGLEQMTTFSVNFQGSGALAAYP